MTAQGYQVHHIDVSTRPSRLETDGGSAFVVFWWRDLPLAAKTFSADELPLTRAALHDIVARAAGEQREARDPALGAPPRAVAEGAPEQRLTIRSALAAGGLIDWLEHESEPSQASADRLAVVICTRDRPEALARCLRAVCGQNSPAGEIIVVDNSSVGSAASVCERFPVRRIWEPRPGLSRARNAGLRAAQRPLIAFTDDDAEPHPRWTAEVVRAFDRSGADAVTGLVLPARLETDAQCCFQLTMGGFGTRFVPVVFDSSFFDATRDDGAHVWRIGAGANMAFQRAAFERLGSFDPRLGAGASGCSEDSEFWYRILATSGTCLYEPRAVVFHDHREDWPGLERQMRAYMRGHVSALVAQRDRFGHRGNVRRIFRQLPRYFARTAVSTVLHDDRDRRRLLRQEVIGWVAGLSYLAHPRWRRAQFVGPEPDGSQAP